MTITSNLTYRQHSDSIIGYADCGSFDTSHSSAVADQGVLLVVRGLTLRWKQIIGYVLIRHNLEFTKLGCLICYVVVLYINKVLNTSLN